MAAVSEAYSYNFQERGEEGDDEYLEEDDSDDIPNDLTIDYHPGRRDSYHFKEYGNYEINTGDENTVLQNDVGRVEDGKDDGEDKFDYPAENIHATSFDRITSTDAWITPDKTDLVQLCYNFKSNTLKLRNPAEQLSDLRCLTLHDIILLDQNQLSSISKDWSVDLHRQAMSTLKIIEPPKPMNATGWCMDFGLTCHDDWMTQLSKAATYLVEAISMKNMVDIHIIQAVIQLLQRIPKFFY
ncbi:hypothetical protein BD408DRAFT_420564 [Parasitella parasitica]|nr:hypothetical protein BD408DRAFT_420564 [Parasitella parasitica]